MRRHSTYPHCGRGIDAADVDREPRRQRGLQVVEKIVASRERIAMGCVLEPDATEVVHALRECDDWRNE